MKKWIICLLLVAANVALAGQEPGVNVLLLKQKLATLGESKLGLAVIVEPDDPMLAAEVLGTHASVVQILSLQEGAIVADRIAIQEKGGDEVSVQHLTGDVLPYVDNLVNLLVLPGASLVSEAEVQRVMAPGGVCLRSASDGWKSWQKPWPDGMGKWSHYLHDASNNPVGKDRLVDTPKGIQWVGGPRFTRHHDHISSLSAMASWGGRIFYMDDQSSSASIHLPGQWALVAKDAFNGAALWQREVETWVNPLWPLKSGPFSILRRLIAYDDRVYITLGLAAPVSCLDAKTGKERMVFEGSASTREMILHEGKLICLVKAKPPTWGTYQPKNVKSPAEQGVVDRAWSFRGDTSTLKAFDSSTGAVLWQMEKPVAPLSLAASEDAAFFFDGKAIHALDVNTGKERWVSAPVEGGNRSSAGPSYGVNLIATPEVVLFAGGNRRMSAWDAKTGTKLWQAPHLQSGYRSPEDLFVIDGHVLSPAISSMNSSGDIEVRDLLTGKLTRTLAKDTKMGHWPHQRCYRSCATERFIMSSRTGIEFCDVQDGLWFNNHWVRGACLTGIMPCNGLVYAPSHHCLCFAASKLEGFNALSPRSALSELEVTENKLRRGPAYQRLQKRASRSVAPGSWPMHRHDGERSGCTPAPVGDVTGVSWAASLGGSLTSPVIADGTVVVADRDSGSIHALDAETGERRWRFVAGGPVDSAPTLFHGRVVFGCGDGWIYCLDLADGTLAWRFLAAPSERQHVAYGKLESVWPLHGSVLIKDDVIHAVAGRSRFTDGGMRLLRIDPFSGAKLSERVLDERRTGDSQPLQENFNQQRQSWLEHRSSGKGKPVSLMTFNEVGLTDLLTVDGEDLFMRGLQVGFDEDARPSSRRARLTAPWGLVAGDWSHRAGWRYPGAAPSSRILVFNPESRQVFGYGFTVRYQKLLQTYDHHLYGNTGKGSPLWPQQRMPLLARAMVLAGDKLVVAGPPDYGTFDKGESYKLHGQSEFRQEMVRQARAWEGEDGGVLCVVNAKDGARLTQLQLDSPPVFDGMAAADGKLFLATTAGKVVCLGAEQ